MISNLKLKNFQSHKDTEFDFVPGITVVTGATDVGKSSLIRALEWVALNRPPGESSRRHKTKVTSVLLDGVTKMRSASKHQYKADNKVYKALRSDVPKPIYNKLKLTKINFQQQHEAYFLIGDSSGQVAKTLNEVADLQIIDLSRKEVKQRVRSEEAEKKSLEKQLKIKLEKIKELQWVTLADNEYQKIEGLEEKVNDMTEINSIRSNVRECVSQGYRLANIPVISSDIKLITQSLDNVVYDTTLQHKIFDVEDNQISIPDSEDDLIKIEQSVYNLQSDCTVVSDSVGIATDARNCLSDYPHIEDPSKLLGRLEHLNTTLKEVRDAIDGVFDAEVTWSDVGNEWRFLQDRYDEKLKELKICPLCKGDI